MLRNIFWLIAIPYAVALIVLAFQVHIASPGPISQEILGVGIGHYESEGGIAYLSGRRLHCVALDEGEAFNAKCTIMIAGEMLEIHASRNPPTDLNQLGGRCEAFYEGQEWPCKYGSRHVHVHWFAYLNEPLGLDNSELDALRSQYWIENLSESVIVRSVFAIALLTTLLVMALVSKWRWSNARRLETAVLVLVLGAVVYVGSCTFFASLTNGLWD